MPVHELECVQATRRLARLVGRHIGISPGRAYHPALPYLRNLPELPAANVCVRRDTRLQGIPCGFSTYCGASRATIVRERTYGVVVGCRHGNGPWKPFLADRGNLSGSRASTVGHRRIARESPHYRARSFTRRGFLRLLHRPLPPLPPPLLIFFFCFFVPFFFRFFIAVAVPCCAVPLKPVPYPLHAPCI